VITRIKAAFIIGYADGDHRILPDAELVHDDGAILFVGRDYSGPVDREVDAGLSIVSPGFIDLNADWSAPRRISRVLPRSSPRRSCASGANSP